MGDLLKSLTLLTLVNINLKKMKMFLNFLKYSGKPGGSGYLFPGTERIRVIETGYRVVEIAFG